MKPSVINHKNQFVFDHTAKLIAAIKDKFLKEFAQQKLRSLPLKLLYFPTLIVKSPTCPSLFLSSRKSNLLPWKGEKTSAEHLRNFQDRFVTWIFQSFPYTYTWEIECFQFSGFRIWCIQKHIFENAILNFINLDFH